MAEDQGQAATQPALEVMNASQAVEHLSSVIDEEIQKLEKPRDDSGKFAKTETKTEEAQPEKEAAEEKAEDSTQTETDAETKAEARRLKLKYKGEEREVDEAEAIELAQKGFDYTQKSQALAKEREELTTSIKAEKEAALKQYSTQLETYKQAVLKLADPEALNADLNKLSQEDPARALQLMLKRQQIAQTLQAVDAEQQRVKSQQESEAQTKKSKKVSEALETIQRDIPGWGSELYGKVLKTAVESGATQEEANAITEPWLVKVLNEARQWREFKSAKPTVDKRVTAVPKVQKPGTSEKSNPSDKLKVGMDRLSQSGNRDDAVSVVEEMIRLGKL